MRIERLRYIPKELEPGVLYVAEEFGAAAHLCPCGCGSKVSTPLGPADWVLTECDSGPSLYPSIGNWQLACQSHYWIRKGQVVWSAHWTPEQITAGRRVEEERLRAYYDGLDGQRVRVLRRLWNWIKSLFG